MRLVLIPSMRLHLNTLPVVKNTTGSSVNFLVADTTGLDRAKLIR